ncbi:MAG TPA: hypothetical protein VK129_06785 [Terriglobales bacterium]|nr:hypothetical protein [Terriglobales bacterium]
MSGRSGTTFGKLQRERARREKQLEKAARKKQRKLEKQTMPANGEDGAEEFLPGEDAADMPAAEDAPASAANHEPVATFEPVNSTKRD